MNNIDNSNNNNNNNNNNNKINAEKIQKVTNRVNWILSKRIRDVITIFIGSIKIQLSWAIARLLVRRFNSCVTPVVKTFSSDRVAFRIPSNISDIISFVKTANGLNTLAASTKNPHHRLQNADLTRGAVNVRCGWTPGVWNS